MWLVKAKVKNYNKMEEQNNRKNVLITGSSRGLGENLANVFSEKGYDIILHGRNKDRLIKIKKELEKKVDCEIISGDIRDQKTLVDLTEAAKRKDISVLINNSAIDDEREFNEMSLSDIDAIIETNLFSPIKLTHKIYPLFMEKGCGTIININAMDGLRNIRGKVAYTTSKQGLKGFTDSLRYEAKRNNVRIIGVYLGGMQTDMYSSTGRNVEGAMPPREVAEIIFNVGGFGIGNVAGVDDIIIDRIRI